MVREFEGATEQEAVAKAMAVLGLEQDEFDVEVLEESKKGFFKKGTVKIRVHFDGPEETENYGSDDEEVVYEPDPDMENQVKTFVEMMIRKMGFSAQVKMNGREGNKVFFDIETPDTNLLIGKHGKNLDALQLLANVFAGKLLGGDQKIVKIILDSEDYRNRREDHLVRLALKTAQQVRRTRVSKLLEPMNPFERRLIHTTLNNMKDVQTESEGEGLIKQVRISYVDR